MLGVSTLLLPLFVFVINTGLLHGSCPALYDEIDGRCFLVVETKFPFASARDICQNYNGDLAVVSECSLLGSLSEYLETNYEYTDLWVGASDIASEGEWHWIDGTPVELGVPYWGRVNASDFDPEPNGGLAENCAALKIGGGGYFKDLSCDRYPGYSPLCKISLDPETGMCPSPYVLVGGTTCFQFLSAVSATWEEARTICQSSSGDLAIIDDCNLMKSVIDHATQTGSIPETGFWIGGSDEASEGTWRWIDGSSIAMGAPFWGRTDGGPLQPNNYFEQDCLLLWGTDRFLYNDEQCTYEAYPLCQTEPIE